MEQLIIAEHDFRMNPWIQRIKECQNSDMTVRAWCRVNEINFIIALQKRRHLNHFYRKAGRFRHPLVRKIFAEVSAPAVVCTGHIAATIEMGRMRIDIHNGADDITLQNIFRIVSAHAG